MEDILIPIVVFSSLLLFLKMMLDYARFKHEHKAGARSERGRESNSLRVSELEALVHDAVDDAVRPLERRIRQLERAARRGGDVAPGGLLLGADLDAEFDSDLDDERSDGFRNELRDDDRRVRQPRVRRS